MKSIAFNITCPHCRGEMRHITRDDPKGWSTRERRAVVECIKPHCHYTGVVVVELIDLSHKRAVA